MNTERFPMLHPLQMGLYKWMNKATNSGNSHGFTKSKVMVAIKIIHICIWLLVIWLEAEMHTEEYYWQTYKGTFLLLNIFKNKIMTMTNPKALLLEALSSLSPNKMRWYYTNEYAAVLVVCTLGHLVTMEMLTLAYTWQLHLLLIILGRLRMLIQQVGFSTVLY